VFHFLKSYVCHFILAGVTATLPR